MSTRKLGKISLPPERRTEIFNAYSLEQVCEMLTGYLNGEISVHINRKRSGNKGADSKKKPAACQEKAGYS